MSVFVVRAFVQMRELLTGTRELARQLRDLEARLTSRLDTHEAAIVKVLRSVRWAAALCLGVFVVRSNPSHSQFCRGVLRFLCVRKPSSGFGCRRAALGVKAPEISLPNFCE